MSWRRNGNAFRITGPLGRVSIGSSHKNRQFTILSEKDSEVGYLTQLMHVYYRSAGHILYR